MRGLRVLLKLVNLFAIVSTFYALKDASTHDCNIAPISQIPSLHLQLPTRLFLRIHSPFGLFSTLIFLFVPVAFRSLFLDLLPLVVEKIFESFTTSISPYSFILQDFVLDTKQYNFERPTKEAKHMRNGNPPKATGIHR